MNWLLLSAALGLNIVYDDQATCKLALEQVKEIDRKAMCLPSGRSEEEMKFNQMVDIMIKFMDTQKTEK